MWLCSGAHCSHTGGAFAPSWPPNTCSLINSLPVLAETPPHHHHHVTPCPPRIHTHTHTHPPNPPLCRLPAGQGRRAQARHHHRGGGAPHANAG